MRCSLEAHPGLAAVLVGGAGESATQPPVSSEDLGALCEAEELNALVYQRVAVWPGDPEWSAQVLALVGARAHADVAAELLRGAEIRRVLRALAEAGVRPILMKGAALAYTVYSSPAARARSDTDLLIAEHQVDRTRAVLASLDYGFAVHCSDLFSQFEAQKLDRFGVHHVFDVHWKISTQPVFENLLTYKEALARAQPVPALGDAALALEDVDALMVACVHPTMHHRNDEPVLWVYDVHLLAARLSSRQWEAFGALARSKRVAAVCLHRLHRAQALLGTDVPDAVLSALATSRQREPSAAYLASERRWHDELASSVAALPSLGARARLLRKVVLPDRDYVLDSYGLRGKPFVALLLPALYVHRIARGMRRILAGEK
jgi:hypothetical protein